MTSDRIERATRDAEPWIERLARVGYFAIGAVYLIAGGLTAAAAFQSRRETTDRTEVLAFILDKPFGKVVLLLMVIGLAGYSFWRITSGIIDSDRRGRKPMGLAKRAAAIVSGLTYGVLMIQVVRLLTNGGQGGTDDAEAAQSTSRVLQLPFGRTLVALGGLTLVAVGLYQLGLAFKAKLSRRLDLSSLETRTRSAVVAISRFGIGARGIVFGVIGASLVMAAVRQEAGLARGLSGALVTLSRQPFGQMLLAIVAVGLVAFGVHAIANGFYRRIDAT